MSFNFNPFVIGAGSGGVRATRFTTDSGARVAVAESRYLNGTYVDVGCVPKKLLIYGAHFNEDFEQTRAYGWGADEAQFDWATLIGDKNRGIQRLSRIYRNLLVSNRVILLKGHARLLDAYSVEVDGQRFSAEHILVATGGWPQMPDIPGKEHVIISNGAFFLECLLRRVLVVDGDYIAAELASVFSELGAETTLLYRRDLFPRDFDRSVCEHLRGELGKKGLDLQFNSDIARIDKRADGSLAATLKDGRVLEANCVFYATGRRPILGDLGLESTRVKLTDRGFIAVDEHYQTSKPSILALGDVIGRARLTPVALAEGIAVTQWLFKPEEYRPVDHKLIPTAVFSLPSIGTVGLTEEEALNAGHRVKIFESCFWPTKLTLTDDQEKALMELAVDVHDDRVLDCHMISAEAGEILQGVTVAMKTGATRQAFDETIGIHPTATEEFVTLRTPTR